MAAGRARQRQEVILTDTGFWVALLNTRDAHHHAALAAFERAKNEPLVTTWSVLTESVYLLSVRANPEIARKFLHSIALGLCQLRSQDESALVRMHTLMGKYRDLPMDLADASLVVLAEQLGEGRILSTDTRDFGAYRWKDTKPFSNLMEA